MKKKNKRILKFGAFAGALLILSACTASFCAPVDSGHLYYNIDNGLVYTDENNVALEKPTYNAELSAIIKAASDKGYTTPSLAYFVELDKKVLNFAVERFEASNPGHTLGTEERDEKALDQYGYLKFLGKFDDKSKTVASNVSTEGDLFANITYWNHQIATENPEIGFANIPDKDFTAFYKKQMTTKVGAFRACIALDEGQYGPDGEKTSISAKDWGYAFKRGPIEGLLVFPVAAMLEGLTSLFGAGGWGQIGAIILVTIIVRTILILLTFKSTMGTQKMQLLQPEMAKLQQKFPNSESNKYEKQLLTQAQMALYKKNKINPMGSILVMIVQFPIFIAVWGAMTGSASLASDSVLGLNLNAQLGNSMVSNWFSPGWWTAVVLFIIMGVSQFVSMKITTWLSKSKTKNISKMGANPAADKTAKQTKWMTTIMFGLIIFMSWTLPAAMGVYWLFGAIISIIQSFVMHKIMNRKKA